MNDEVEAVKKILKKKRRIEEPAFDPADHVSTNVPLLNVALSGHTNGGIHKGYYIRFVGDSGALKTWIMLNTMAAACLDSNFKNYRLIYDGPERGARMDLAYFFGRLSNRIETPDGSKVKSGQCSDTNEAFYYNLDDALKKGPCIYGLDSMDALQAKADQEIFQKRKEAYYSGKEGPGNMGMAPAKVNSQNIKPFASRLDNNGSILIVISQTRDKVNSPFPMKTSGGGRALKFHAHLEVWTSVRGSISKTVLGKKRDIGSRILMDIQKNRSTGFDSYKIEIPFYRKTGIDHVGASVDYLVDEGHWKETNGKIVAPELGIEGKREWIIEHIQGWAEEDKLSEILQTVWNKIDNACAVKRINPFRS